MADTHLTVTSTERLSPGMVRVRFRSEDLSAFAGSEDTDRYVKLVLGTPEEPVVRTYTALDPDPAAGTLTIDFVVHGDAGYAGPWAAAAVPGDTLVARGPGGGYAPDPAADHHLLVGDEAALPAVRAALERLAGLDGATGHAVVQVPGPEHEQPMPAVPGVELTWVHAEHAEALVPVVRDLPWPEGRVQVFVHGEAEVVMHGLRPHLLRERGVARADASISGYWRRGRTEEEFREWKRALAAAEA